MFLGENFCQLSMLKFWNWYEKWILQKINNFQKRTPQMTMRLRPKQRPEQTTSWWRLRSGEVYVYTPISLKNVIFQKSNKEIQAAASEVNFRRAVFSLLTMIAGGSTLALDYCFVKKWENRKFVMIIKRNRIGPPQKSINDVTHFLRFLTPPSPLSPYY